MTAAQRTCTKCHQAFPATKDWFNTSRGGRFGLKSWCITCEREQARIYRLANIEKIRAGHRNYRLAYPERIHERDRKWREKNRKKLLAYGRKWRKENPEYQRKWREKKRKNK